MVNTLKTILRKASKLSRIATAFNDVHWPAGVLNYLEVKHHLRPDDMRRLWYIRQKVSKNKYRYDSLFIYDWAAAHDRKVSIRNLRDLHSNSELLRFKGNLFVNGVIRLDRVEDYENN